MKYTYDFPRASITADVVVLRETDFKSFEVLCVVRKNEPWKGCYALPGGFVDIERETCQEAAIRELKEETSIDAKSYRPRYIGVYDEPHRDSRGRVITHAYSVVIPDSIGATAGDDAADVRWLQDSEILLGKAPVAFDHITIIRDAINIEKRNMGW